MMEEGEEEQLEPDDIRDTAMGEAEDEADAKGAPVEDDALCDVIRDAQKDCESKKEKTKFGHMLEDHKKILYPSAQDGQKKTGYNTGVVKMEGTEWCIR